MFHPGHIEILKIVQQEATKLGAKVVVGIHDDAEVNQYKGLNYPIMNLLKDRYVFCNADMLME